MPVSREAQTEVGSLTGRAAWVKGNECRGTQVWDGALGAKVNGIYPREGCMKEQRL